MIKITKKSSTILLLIIKLMLILSIISSTGCNIIAYRERLKEIEYAYQMGEIDFETYQYLRNDLEVVNDMKKQSMREGLNGLGKSIMMTQPGYRNRSFITY